MLALCRPTDTALVLGSTEDLAHVDLEAAERLGISVERRRSGGAAVLLGPARQCWIDLYLPAADHRYELDVAKAAEVVGEAWWDALVAGGVPAGALVVHRGALIHRRHSREVCFLGTGPGELLLEGQKLVGLSQRRDRHGAWFFTMAPRILEPELEAALIDLPLEARQEVSSDLASYVTTLAEPGDERIAELLAAALDQR